MRSPLYEVTVEGEPARRLTAEALIEAWGESVPDLAARALDLSLGSGVMVSQNPDVAVRRIR